MIQQLIANFGQAGLPLVLWAGVLGVLATVVLAIVRVRRGGQPVGEALARSAGECGIVVSLFAVLIVGLWRYDLATVRGVHLIPLIDFIQQPASAVWWTPIQFALGNMLLFLPLGLCVQLRFRKLSVARIAMGAAALAIVIEAWQWVFGTGRVASTDDVLFNTAGAVIGALIVRGVASIYRRATATHPSPDR